MRRRWVNRPIVRLYGLVVLLFALLVAFTSRWTVFEASSLRSNPLNKRALLEQQQHRPRQDPRRRRHGARAQRARARKAPTNATYPSGEEFAHAIGYSYSSIWASRGSRALPQRGAERSDRHEPAERSSTSCRASAARATKSSPRSTRGPAGGDRGARGTRRRGRRARPAHRGGRGDGLDAELRPKRAALATAPTQGSTDSTGSPLVNRATQFGYAPGSTFKVVTATAAIDTGQFTPHRR